jgi:hypothetical protein
MKKTNNTQVVILQGRIISSSLIDFFGKNRKTLLKVQPLPRCARTVKKDKLPLPYHGRSLKNLPRSHCHGHLCLFLQYFVLMSVKNLWKFAEDLGEGAGSIFISHTLSPSPIDDGCRSVYYNHLTPHPHPLPEGGSCTGWAKVGENVTTTYRKAFWQNVCSLLTRWKYMRRVISYELVPEFCALFEYGLRNIGFCLSYTEPETRRRFVEAPRLASDLTEARRGEA